jgi:hypothetical protein
VPSWLLRCESWLACNPATAISNHDECAHFVGSSRRATKHVVWNAAGGSSRPEGIGKQHMARLQVRRFPMAGDASHGWEQAKDAKAKKATKAGGGNLVRPNVPDLSSFNHPADQRSRGESYR